MGLCVGQLGSMIWFRHQQPLWAGFLAEEVEDLLEAQFVAADFPFDDDPFDALRLPEFVRSSRLALKLRRDAYRIGDLRRRAFEEFPPA